MKGNEINRAWERKKKRGEAAEKIEDNDIGF